MSEQQQPRQMTIPEAALHLAIRSRDALRNALAASQDEVALRDKQLEIQAEQFQAIHTALTAKIEELTQENANLKETLDTRS